MHSPCLKRLWLLKPPNVQYCLAEEGKKNLSCPNVLNSFSRTDCEGNKYLLLDKVSDLSKGHPPPCQLLKEQCQIGPWATFCLFSSKILR